MPIERFRVSLLLLALLLALASACSKSSSSSSGGDGQQTTDSTTSDSGTDSSGGVDSSKEDSTTPDAGLDTSGEDTGASDLKGGEDASGSDTLSDGNSGEDTGGGADATTSDSADVSQADAADVTTIEPNACTEPTDCQSPVLYYKEVKSEVDCYCPMCENQTVHINTATHVLYKASWEAHCKAWIESNPCPKSPCPMIVPRTCVNKVCQADVSKPSACEDTSECMQGAVYNKNVTKVEECYCPTCDDPDVSLNATTGAIYAANWKLYCSDWAKQNPCPVPKCLAPLYRECKDKTCQIKPNGCGTTYECAHTVLYTKPVNSEADCYCVGCDDPTVSLTKRLHDMYQSQWQTHCTEWVKTAGCPAVKCAASSPRVCVDDTCVSSRSCTIKDDCEQNSRYTKPVSTLDDCYCIGCAKNPPISTIAHQIYTSQWTSTCSSWTPDPVCQVPVCVKPPTSTASVASARPWSAEIRDRPSPVPTDPAIPPRPTRPSRTD